MDTRKKHLQCDICEKSFKQLSALNIHKRIHSGDRPHKCDFCGKGFTQTGTLTIHRRLHNNERPYCCEVCQKTFSNSSALTRHKRTHTGEKPHECDVCSKKFSVKGGLKIHKRVHTNEMPYQCDVCQRQFRQAGRLRYHKQTHDEKVYDCDACKKVFKNSLNLRRHQLQYEKMAHKCDVCECKSFADSEQLAQHKKSHSHIYNSYMQSVNRNLNETSTAVLKEDGGKSYEACNKKPCDEAVSQYHKIKLGIKNRDKFKQQDSTHSGKVLPDCNVENVDSSQALPTFVAKESNEAGNSKPMLKDGAQQSDMTFVCEQCGSNFTSDAILKNHVEESHN